MGYILYCDKCGKEIKRDQISTAIGFVIDGAADLDEDSHVCEECRIEIYTILGRGLAVTD